MGVFHSACVLRWHLVAVFLVSSRTQKVSGLMPGDLKAVVNDKNICHWPLSLPSEVAEASDSAPICAIA